MAVESREYRPGQLRSVYAEPLLTIRGRLRLRCTEPLVWVSQSARACERVLVLQTSSQTYIERASARSLSLSLILSIHIE